MQKKSAVFLFFLLNNMFAQEVFDFTTPTYNKYFIEDFDRNILVLVHNENAGNKYKTYSGVMKNGVKKMHAAIGPELGLVVNLSNAKSNLDSLSGAKYDMGGFLWNAQQESDYLNYEQDFASMRLYPRHHMALGPVNLLFFGGLDALSLKESALAKKTDRKTRLLYLPLGVSIFGNESMIFQLSLSPLLWGDVKLNSHAPKVSKGYGMLFGLVWRSSNRSSCVLDWGSKLYDVKDDDFSLGSNNWVKNSISSWNAKCSFEA